MTLLPTDEPRRSQQLSIWEGALAVIFVNWATGVVTTGYALWLGANPAALAVLGALPLVAQMAAPSALFFRGSRKRLSIRLAATGRAVFGAVLFLPLLPEDWRVPGLLLFAALSQLIISPVNVLWTSWMADLVPEEKRGRYFGFRNGLLGLVGTLGNLAAGVVIDALGKPWGFLLVIAVGVGLGIAATRILHFQLEPPSTPSAPTLKEFFSPLSDRTFRGFLGFVVFFLGAVSVGGPFAIPLFLEYTQMSFTQIGLWTVISAVTGLVMGPLWGRIADRIGHWWVLLFTSVVAAVLLPGLWLLGRPGFLEPIWASAVIDAIAWVGLGTALTNIVLQGASPERRNLYLSLYWLSFALGGVLGSVLGGILGSLHAVLQFGPTPYHFPIVVSLLLRLGAVGYLVWRMRKNADKARESALREAGS
ncbi:MAG: MFS transporter [Meiothermus sp.]|nr:MFS transporter [Meiothermus sp.]